MVGRGLLPSQIGQWFRMGIESVSYRFKPVSAEFSEVVDWLRSHGARSGGTRGAFIISGDDYWIDLIVRADGRRVAVVQFRVAITNPISIVENLDDLFSRLRISFAGFFTDARGRVLEDRDRSSVLLEDFSTARSRFVEVFGEIVMPVSADRVFDMLRATEKDSG